MILSTSNLEELTQLVARMRELGIAAYSKDGVKIVLDPHPPMQPDIEDSPKAQGLDLSTKVGKDGLTKDQQLELYGRSMQDVEE